MNVSEPAKLTTERRDSLDSEWSDYRLEWLFDPDRYDHLPIEEQLNFFAQRNLRKVKIYKIATQLWGAPIKRKRKIIAPAMYPEGTNPFRVPPSAPAITSELKPQKPPPVMPTKEEILEKEERERLNSYEDWIKERKKFRNNLENMGLNEEWLKKKPNKTALEQRVLNKIIADRTPKQKDLPAPVDESAEAVLPEQSPIVKRPSPLAIRLIEQFLHDKKMRLLDLFALVDKDKNWKISREEFREAIQKAQIPISEVLLEDLILALDTDLSNELDYRELAKGMGLWKIEKRESKRKIVSNYSSCSPSRYSQLTGFESPERYSSLSTTLSAQKSGPTDPASPQKDFALGGRSQSPSNRVKSALSNISSGSSYLEPPPPDLRPEQRLESSDEAMVDLRKRDREALTRLQGGKCRGQASSGKNTTKEVELSESGKTVIKTGDKPVDDHSMPSTMTGETSDLVDKFRQLKLREYNEIINLCKQNSVVLSERLLSKVLLFPPDKMHSQLKKSVRQPREELVSVHFADPPKRPKTPIEERKTESVKVSRTGRLLMDSRNAYPPRYQVAAVPHKMHLSTGKAVVRSRVDCWMTFEEYDRLTRHMATRYTQIHGRVDQNAFWPGHLLHKVRLCMPHTETKSGSFFTAVKKENKIYPGYNDLLNWTANDSGYIQEGTLIPYKNKFIE